MRRRIHAPLILALFVSLELATTGNTAELNPGDIVVTVLGLDEGRSLMKIHPITGDRETISGVGIGTGPELQYPLDVVQSADGSLYVTDRDLEAIVRVDPTTGNRRIVSGSGVGQGPQFSASPQDVISITIQAGTDDLWAAVPSLHRIMRVDPATGFRETIASNDIGSGPKFQLLTDIGFTQDGRMLAVDQGLNAILSVDPSNGNREFFSGGGAGLGAAFTNATFFGIGPSDEIVVADWGGKLITVDAKSGNRTLLASGEAFLDTLFDVTLGNNGEIHTSHPFDNQMYTVDRYTGQHSLLSATPIFSVTTDRGEGPPLNTALLMDVVAAEVQPVFTEAFRVAPIYDAQADCFFSNCQTKDDELAVHPINFPNAGVNTDRRGILEFDLSDAPSDKPVIAAHVEVSISHFHTDDEGDVSELSLYGFQGSGTIPEIAPETTEQLLGRTGPITERGVLAMKIDPKFVQESLDGKEILGVLLKSDSKSLSTSFWTSEFFERFPQSTEGLTQPTLVLSFESSGLVGDFNQSGEYESEDIDQLCQALGSQDDDSKFDLNADGKLSSLDVDTLLNQMNVLAGDTDLSGEVDFADFLSLSAHFGQSSLWHQGDFDCSGDTGFPDFLSLSGNFGKTGAAVSVPEPTNLLSTWLILLLLAARQMVTSTPNRFARSFSEREN